MENWVDSHPHFKQREYFRGENVIYTANANFSLNENKPDSGLFKFNKDLILTDENKSRTN